MLHEIDLARADLNLLVLFDVVLAERHVGRAAERLSLSPSAVSHGLGRLRRLLNDPLFLKTPRGVVPTSRAEELAGPVADVLARVRSVISTAEPFDPATSRRRFTIGAPDGISAVVLPQLLEAVKRRAPGIDIGIRQILPAPVRVWQSAIEDLDARALDLAVVPIDDIPARFAERLLYEEDFVVASAQAIASADGPRSRASAPWSIWSFRFRPMRMASSTIIWRSRGARGGSRSRSPVSWPLSPSSRKPI